MSDARAVPGVAVLHSLRPNVSEAEALTAFRGGIGARLAGLWGTPLRALAAVYVPFHLYRVEIANGPRRQTSHFAIDAVSGVLDLYRFEDAPADEALVEVRTRNRLAPRLADGEARHLLGEKLRRAVFQTGFFRVRSLSFDAQLAPLELHVPYWVGFHGDDAVRGLRVLDAVRRRFEGGKARALFDDWLRDAAPPHD